MVEMTNKEVDEFDAAQADRIMENLADSDPVAYTDKMARLSKESEEPAERMTLLEYADRQSGLSDTPAAVQIHDEIVPPVFEHVAARPPIQTVPQASGSRVSSALSDLRKALRAVDELLGSSDDELLLEDEVPAAFDYDVQAEGARYYALARVIYLEGLNEFLMSASEGMAMEAILVETEEGVPIIAPPLMFSLYGLAPVVALYYRLNQTDGALATRAQAAANPDSHIAILILEEEV